MRQSLLRIQRQQATITAIAPIVLRSQKSLDTGVILQTLKNGDIVTIRYKDQNGWTLLTTETGNW
jgi:hypothetical protein